MKVIIFSALVLLSVVSTSQAGFLSTMSQMFGFTKIQEPKYEVLQKMPNNIEIRKYAPATWVETSYESKMSEMKSFTRTTFFKLFNFINGNNDKNKKIPMTAPVATFMQSVDGKTINKDSMLGLTMAFYMAEADSMKPKDTTVRIETAPETTYATIRFGGWASTNDWIEHRDKLIEALGATEAAKYDTVNMITAGYDAPFMIFNRRNEVWLMKKN